MYARQRTARRCYLRRLLGCFRHSGRSQRPEYRRAFRKTLRLHAVLRIALIHTRQRTALRCYLRRLAPLVRPPPQPPKISFEVLRFGEPCGPQPLPRGGPLFAFAHCASPRSPRPEYRCLFVKQALRLRAVRRRPTAADCNSLYARLRPPPSANRTPAGRKNTSNNKKSIQFVVRFNYLYYFWGKRSVGKDVNRIAVTVNVRNLL